MNKEYWLIQHIKSIGHKNPVQIVDRVLSIGLKEARREFEHRNSMQKLLEKGDLIICKSEEWIQ